MGIFSFINKTTIRFDDVMQTFFLLYKFCVNMESIYHSVCLALPLQIFLTILPFEIITFIVISVVKMT